MNEYLISFMILQRPDDYTTNIHYGDTLLPKQSLLDHKSLTKLREELAIEHKTTMDLVTFTHIYKFEKTPQFEFVGSEPSNEWGK
jgi:hypothetical protein